MTSLSENQTKPSDCLSKQILFGTREVFMLFRNEKNITTFENLVKIGLNTRNFIQKETHESYSALTNKYKKLLLKMARN